MGIAGFHKYHVHRSRTNVHAPGYPFGVSRTLMKGDSLQASRVYWLPDGSTLNTTVALARLGFPVCFLPTVGDLALRLMYPARIRSRGVWSSAFFAISGPMPLALVRLDEAGNAEHSLHRHFQAPFRPWPGSLA